MRRSHLLKIPGGLPLAPGFWRGVPGVFLGRFLYNGYTALLQEIRQHAYFDWVSRLPLVLIRMQEVRGSNPLISTKGLIKLSFLQHP